MGLFRSISEIISDSRLAPNDRRQFSRFKAGGTVSIQVAPGSEASGQLIDLSYGGFSANLPRCDVLHSILNRPLSTDEMHLHFFGERIPFSGQIVRYDGQVCAVELRHQDGSSLADLREILEPLRVGGNMQRAGPSTINGSHIIFNGDDDAELKLEIDGATLRAASLIFRDGGQAFEITADEASVSVLTAQIESGIGRKVTDRFPAVVQALRTACFLISGIRDKTSERFLEQLVQRMEQQVVSNSERNQRSAA
jgi:hypothetical protein